MQGHDDGVVGPYCNACELEFQSDEGLRHHYSSDLHRYNLQRRAAGRGAMGQEEFDSRRSQALRQAKGPAKGTAAAHGVKFRCKVTGKLFSTRQQLQQHMRSKKYKAALAELVRQREAAQRAAAAEAAQAGDDDDAGSSDSDSSEGEGRGDGEEEPAAAPAVEQPTAPAVRLTTRDVVAVVASDPAAEKPQAPRRDPSFYDDWTIFSRCAFCGTEVDGLAGHMEHATRAHGFSIPDEEFLVDLRSLVEHMMAKVLGNAQCVYCDKVYRDPEACMQHMGDTGHCRLPVDLDGGEAMEEFDDYYDFSALLPMLPEEEQAETRAAMAAAARRAGDAAGAEAGEAAAEAEEAGGAAAGGGAGAAGLDEEEDDDDGYGQWHHIRRRREVWERKGFEQLGGGEVKTPAGKVLGPRVLRKYYQQKFDFAQEDTRLSVVAQRRETQARMERHAQALVVRGGRGGRGGALSTNVGLPHFFTKEERKAQKAQQRSQSDWQRKMLHYQKRSHKHLGEFFKDSTMIWG